MNKTKILLTIIVLVSSVPALILCTKNIRFIDSYQTDGALSEGLETLASEVESGKYSNIDIAEKFRKMAKAERTIESGIDLMVASYYFWVILFLFLAAVQVYLLRQLVTEIKNTTT